MVDNITTTPHPHHPPPITADIEIFLHQTIYPPAQTLDYCKLWENVGKSKGLSDYSD